MDYVVGSVAALVSGNVTPNRPKFMKRALTPTKHQPSPNVTPKSVVAEDRSIFLSPTMQKKKAIVKKSPKRIFQNPDLDVTIDDGTKPKSPKADKVKKHLREDLEANVLNPNSPKNKKSKVNDLQIQNNTNKPNESVSITVNTHIHNGSTPKKKKRQSLTSEDNIHTSITLDASVACNDSVNTSNITGNVIDGDNKTKLLNVSLKKTKNRKNKSNVQLNTDCKIESKEDNVSEILTDCVTRLPVTSLKTKNKQKRNPYIEEEKPIKVKSNKKPQPENFESENNNQNDDVNKSERLENGQKKKNRKQKNKSKPIDVLDNIVINAPQDNEMQGKKKKKRKSIVNPNAITDKDTDSEHDSDDNIESENEENNKEVLDTGPVEESSDEEEKVPEKKENIQKNKETTVNTEEEVKRTLFVGNVRFSTKCKKEIKKIFNKYGQIETVRIRTVPVKDGRATPKIAVIKNELHPDRSTVNVYVKFQNASSVTEALAENGTVLNGYHLRVTRSDCTGSELDHKCSVFIGNLPFALEDDALQQKFQQCGEIISVRIVRDRKTSAGKGFGYVNFKSKDAVELALALSEEELTMKNRILRVKRCTPSTTRAKPQQDNRRGNLQSNYGRGNADRNQGRAGAQGNYGRGNTQEYQGRAGAQGNYGRGNTHGYHSRENTQGNYSRGSMQGNYGRGNVQSRNQFGSREDGRQVGRATFNDTKADGAMRRLMNKRTIQDGGEGPPNKMQRGINQPGKKTRKEFVGMTAEKKKKSKINKGQKKKKALSEILTK